MAARPAAPPPRALATVLGRGTGFGVLHAGAGAWLCASASSDNAAVAALAALALVSPLPLIACWPRAAATLQLPLLACAAATVWGGVGPVPRPAIGLVVAAAGWLLLLFGIQALRDAVKAARLTDQGATLHTWLLVTSGAADIAALPFLVTGILVASLASLATFALFLAAKLLLTVGKAGLLFIAGNAPAPQRSSLAALAGLSLLDLLWSAVANVLLLLVLPSAAAPPHAVLACAVAAADIWAIALVAVVTYWCIFDREGLFEALLPSWRSPSIAASADNLELRCSPCSALLAPFILHTAVFILPQVIALGAAAGEERWKGGEGLLRHLAIQFLVGLGAVGMLAFGTAAEASEHRLLPIVGPSTAVVACGVLGFHVFEATVLGDARQASSVLSLLVASFILFWEACLAFFCFLCVSQAQHTLQGGLWGVAFPVLAPAYYGHEDAKTAGEACIASFACGAACLAIVFPFDALAVFYCSPAHAGQQCDTDVRGVNWVVLGGDLLWFLSTAVLVLHTRLRSPLGVVLPCRGHRHQHVWILDWQQRVALLTSFGILVLQLFYATKHSPSRLATSFMITSGSFRLCFLLLAVFVDLSTMEERTNASINALGTAFQVYQLSAAERAARAGLGGQGGHGGGVGGAHGLGGGGRGGGVELDVEDPALMLHYGSIHEHGLAVQRRRAPQLPGPHWWRVFDAPGAVRWVSTEPTDAEKEGAAGGEVEERHGEEARTGATAADAEASDDGRSAAGCADVAVACLVRGLGGSAEQGSAELIWTATSFPCSRRKADVAMVEGLLADARARGTAGAAGEASLGDTSTLAALPFDRKVTWFRETTDSLRIPWEEGHEEISVHRQAILDEVAARITELDTSAFRKTFRFFFAAEPGLDAGGVAREFFTTSLKAIFDTDEGPGFFLTQFEDHPRYQITPLPTSAPADDRCLRLYHVTGRLLGKALFDGQTLPVRLSRPLYAHLVGLPCSFADLADYDPTLARQLRWLLDHPGEVDGLGLDFSVTYELPGGGHVTDELEPSGRDRGVTAANCARYVDLRWRRRVLLDLCPQLSAFLRGFFDVVPQALLSVFTPAELEVMMCGEDAIDLEDWKRHTDYAGALERGITGGRGHAGKVVRWFWEVVRDLEEPQRRRLLLFATGSAGVPFGGFKQLIGNDGVPRRFTLRGVELLQRAGSDPEEAELLPKAHTCFNRLDLPLYRSKQQMETVLRSVIEHETAITGFGYE